MDVGLGHNRKSKTELILNENTYVSMFLDQHKPQASERKKNEFVHVPICQRQHEFLNFIFRK